MRSKVAAVSRRWLQRLFLPLALMLGIAGCWTCSRSACGQITGTEVPALGAVDQMMVAFLQKHHIPGATLAVTNAGRLVLARGYGVANQETGEPVTPTHRFRIASISKPLTAVAILRLVDEGKLALDDRVFDRLDYREEIGRIENFDQRQHQITIRQLLQHRGGWDRDISFDAMFMASEFAAMMQSPPPASPDVVIRAMLRHQLDFAPGERYAYSNYGYCLLGRVIERQTGMPYEQYVRTAICEPLGMQKTVLGKTRITEQLPDEVHYHDPERLPSVFAENLNELVSSAYGGWCLESMDAHGGWLSTAVDLARFACAFDDQTETPIISATMLSAMRERPTGQAGLDPKGNLSPTYYGLGWSIRALQNGKTNEWHTGSLPGTATILIRRHDKKNFVVLMNTRVSPESNSLTADIDPLLHQAADAVHEWPDHNLFADYLRQERVAP